MSRMIRRMILAAAVGLFAAGVASAQQPMPAIPLAYAPQGTPAVQVQPKPLPGAPGAAPAYVVPGHPVAAPVAVPTQPGCGYAAAPYGGCDSCGSAKKGGHHGRLGIGAGCANSVGCSTCAQERTFLFGSCNQFFNAGNNCGHGFGFGRCATGPIGTGIPACGPCVYGSYLNR